MKTCFRCKINKNLTDFHKGNSLCKVCYKIYWDQYYKTHKDEKLAKNRAYYKKDPVKHRLRERLKRRLELGLEILPEPENCEICHRITVKALALDHDHVTGKSRGYLCNTCNTGLGLFRDSEELLMQAIQYLKRTTVAQVSQ